MRPFKKPSFAGSNQGPTRPLRSKRTRPGPGRNTIREAGTSQQAKRIHPITLPGLAARTSCIQGKVHLLRFRKKTVSRHRYPNAVAELYWKRASKFPTHSSDRAQAILPNLDTLKNRLGGDIKNDGCAHTPPIFRCLRVPASDQGCRRC